MLKRAIAVFSVLVSCVGLMGCKASDGKDASVHIPVSGSQSKIDYTLSQVLQGDLENISQISCTYKPARKESLSFSVGGIAIEQIYVTQGQQVRAGALLATLDQKSLQTKRASYVREQSELELERQQLVQKQELEQTNGQALLSQLQQLYDAASEEEQPTIAQQLQDAKQELEQAIASYDRKITTVDDSLYILSLRLKELDNDLAGRYLYAGISGTVTYIQELMPGQRVVKGEHFMTISDFSSAAFVVKGESSKNFTSGDTVVITCSSKTYECHVYSGKSLGLSDEMDGQPCVYIKPDVPDPSLTEGQKGSVDITVASAENAIYVVKEAIRTGDDGNYVFVTDAEGLRSLRKVCLGIETDDYIQITEGLQPGEYVILD